MDNVRQLSLWENAALEEGYRLLAALNFNEAISQFREALKGPGEKDAIQKNIETAQYWQSRIQNSFPKNISSEQINNLLNDFIGYPFLPRLKKFKEALLLHITELISKEDCKELQIIRTAFDQLILLEVFQQAEDLILYALKHYPEKYDLLYSLAQAQWLKGIQAEANGNYLRALLYYPDAIHFDSIENKRLKTLTKVHTPEMIPAYAWIEGVLNFITLKNKIKPFNELHEKGIKCYCLLQKAEKALQDNDTKLIAHYRLKLKLTDPELYQKYFDLLQQRKGIFAVAGQGK